MQLQKSLETRAGIETIFLELFEEESSFIILSGQYGEDKKRKSGSFGLGITGIAHIPLRDVHTGLID